MLIKGILLLTNAPRASRARPRSRHLLGSAGLLEDGAQTRAGPSRATECHGGLRWGEPGSAPACAIPELFRRDVRERSDSRCRQSEQPAADGPHHPRPPAALAGEAFGTFVLTLSGTVTLLVTAHQPRGRTRPRIGQGSGSPPRRDPDHAVPSSYTQIRRGGSMERVVALVMGLIILLGGATA